jgi:hypothetical protein
LSAGAAEAGVVKAVASSATSVDAAATATAAFRKKTKVAVLERRSNVNTVKEHTFHKRSTNVPTANRNETKTSEFVPESAPSKEHISIWSRRADSGPNRNNLFSTRQIQEHYQIVLVSFPKPYQNICPFLFDISREEGRREGTNPCQGEEVLKHQMFCGAQSQPC